MKSKQLVGTAALLALVWVFIWLGVYTRHGRI